MRGNTVTQLTRLGDSLALVFDQRVLEALAVAGVTSVQLELSTDGDVLVVTPVRDPKRKERIARLAPEVHEQYGGVFRPLAG